jgi:NADH-quinone oxidoreductase subunit L
MGAGIVIHALAAEQDIRKMGGLQQLMPLTAVAMWIGALALVGIPPFAGFFSKDAVLASALAHGTFGAVLWVLGMSGTFLTGLYTFRMIFLVFGGEPSPFVREHFHALKRDIAGLTLAVPVGVLAVLSVVGGWLQFDGKWTRVSDFLDPAALPLLEASGTQEAVTSILAVGFGLAGMGLAWWIYGARRAPAPEPSRALEKKLYFDEAYDTLFYKPAVLLSRGLYGLVERPLVAGSILGLSFAVRRLSLGARAVQTGAVRSYALALAAGVAVLIVVFVSVK